MKRLSTLLCSALILTTPVAQAEQSVISRAIKLSLGIGCGLVTYTAHKEAKKAYRTCRTADELDGSLFKADDLDPVVAENARKLFDTVYQYKKVTGGLGALKDAVIAAGKDDKGPDKHLSDSSKAFLISAPLSLLAGISGLALLFSSLK